MFGTISGHNSKDIAEVKHFFGGYREGTEDGEKKEQREEKERERVQMGGGAS